MFVRVDPDFVKRARAVSNWDIAGKRQLNSTSDTNRYYIMRNRAIIKRYGRDCLEFTKIAVVVLNQVVRPFTAQWHRKSLEGSLGNAEQPAFRADLAALQVKLRNYTKMLADMAGVEDLTALEEHF